MKITGVATTAGIRLGCRDRNGAAARPACPVARSPSPRRRTSWAVIAVPIDQPITRGRRPHRANPPLSTRRLSQRSLCDWGPGLRSCDRARWERRRRAAAHPDRAQSTPARARFKGSLPHQSFGPVQPARYAFGEQIMPDTPGPVGSIARQKAGTNVRPQLLIAPAALTARPRQPRIEPTRGTPSAPHNHSAGQIPPVLRNETELHLDSFVK